MKTNLLKYGLTALMIALAMTLCYSCSSDDDEETNQEVNPPSNAAGEINGHAYVELAGLKWATKNVGAVSGVQAISAHATYGYYYTQSNAKKAAKSWSSTWKLPTEDQWMALMDENKCTWTWQDSYLFNGKTMKGYKVSDKKDDSKFIFLPAAGICHDGRSDVYDPGYDGYYWSAGVGRYLNFDDGNRGMDNRTPNFGMAVRLVSE